MIGKLFQKMVDVQRDIHIAFAERITSYAETGDWWQIEYETGENGLAWVADVVVDCMAPAHLHQLDACERTVPMGQSIVCAISS